MSQLQNIVHLLSNNQVSEEFTIANTNGLVAITYQYPMCIYTNMKKQQQQKNKKQKTQPWF